MPLFAMRNIVDNVKRVCCDIIGTRLQRGESLMTEFKAYTDITTRALTMHKDEQLEAAEILQLQHKYATQEVEMSQLYLGTCGMWLNKIKKYAECCSDDKDDVMGHKTHDHDIPAATQECFDASVLLALNSCAIPNVKTLFTHALRNLVLMQCHSMISDDDTCGVYALFASLMHHRYRVLTSKLDCHMHSYVFVNELTQLLIALQDIQSMTATHVSSVTTYVVNLAPLCTQYADNNTMLTKHKCFLPVDDNIAIGLLSKHMVVRLETVLAMQLMLTIMAQREINHIVTQHELNEQVEKLIYDYVSETQKHHLLMLVGSRSEAKTHQAEVSCSLLMCRLKHMLHLRITYLLLRQYRLHIQHELREYTSSNIQSMLYAARMSRARDKIHIQASHLANMLAQSGNIAHALAETIILNIKLKIEKYAHTQRIKMYSQDAHKLIHNLMLKTDMEAYNYIIIDAIKQALITSSMYNIISKAIGHKKQKKQQDALFQVIQNTFNNENNSQFTQYLCSRAHYFLVDICDKDIRARFQANNIHINAVKDAIKFCKATQQNGVYSKSLMKQLHILNDVNHVMTGRQMLQGIHLSYVMELSMLTIAGSRLRAHLKLHMCTMVLNVLHSTYKYTVFGALVAAGIKVVHQFVA